MPAVWVGVSGGTRCRLQAQLGLQARDILHVLWRSAEVDTLVRPARWRCVWRPVAPRDATSRRGIHGHGCGPRWHQQAEFNVGVKETLRHLCDAMGVETGRYLLSSATKADAARVRQAERQAAASTKDARSARRLARTRAADADYAPGAF